jgi:hypothetical protein
MLRLLRYLPELILIDFHDIIMSNGRFGLVPLHKFQASIEVFHDGGATFHEIPGVDI